MRAVMWCTAVLALAGCRISDATFTPGTDQPPDATVDTAIAGGQIQIRLFTDANLLGPTANGQIVAVQDGDGPFVPVTGEGGIYVARVASDRFAVVIACSYVATQTVELFHQMVSDGTTVDATTCSSSTNLVNIEGTATGIQAGEEARIITRLMSVAADTDGSYTAPTTLGNNDVFAVRVSSGNPVSVIRRSNLDLESMTQLSFDFAAEGAAVMKQPFTSNSPNPKVVTSVLNPRGLYQFELQALDLPANPGYDVLPASMMQPDDLLSVSLSDFQTNNGTVQTTKLTRGTGPLELDVTTPVDVPIPALTTDPYLRLTFAIPDAQVTLPIVRYTLAAVTQATGEKTREWIAGVTAAWLAASGSSSYTLPDLSAMPGFTPDMALQQHVSLFALSSRIEMSGTARIEGQETRTSSQVATVPNP